MNKFNHNTDSLFRAVGMSPEREKEMESIFEKLLEDENEGTKSEKFEKLVTLFKPVNDAELLCVGYIFGSFTGKNDAVDVIAKVIGMSVIQGVMKLHEDHHQAKPQTKSKLPN